MDRYSLAAGVAVIALALASPAGARGVHHAGKRAPEAARCAVSARGDALAPPLAGDRALEAKIEQLTGVISALSERLASLEEKLGSPGDQADQDDQDGQDADDSPDDDVSLASARGRAPSGLSHRQAHARRAAPRGHAPQGFAPAV